MSNRSIHTSGRLPNSRHVNTVSTEPTQNDSNNSSDDEYVYTLGHEPGTVRVPETSVEINGVAVKVMIDTGASTDIIDEAAFQKIDLTRPTLLEEDTCRIFAYGSKSSLAVLGKFNDNIRAQGKQITSTIHVLQGTHGSLLSFNTDSKLGLIDIKVSSIATESNLVNQ